MKHFMFKSLLPCIFAFPLSKPDFTANAFQPVTLSRISTSFRAALSEEQTSSEFILGAKQTRQLEQLVEERSQARWEGNYTHADVIRDQILRLEFPDNWQVVVKDIPRKQGGGSTWEVVERNKERPILEGPTVLQLAHAALGLAVESSVQANLGRAHTALGMQRQSSTTIDDNDGNGRLESIVEQVKARFRHANWTDAELAGRKSADAAFWFALSGVTDPCIFETLAGIATRELGRFGTRSSCRQKDIYQMMERFAAAGLTEANELEKAAKLALMAKEGASLPSANNVASLLDFHSDRSLLLIWKFSTKQKKQRSFLQSALKHWQRKRGEISEEERVDSIEAQETESSAKQDRVPIYDWERMFRDPSRPLVIDVGCGMGVSPLGLATENNPISAQVLLGDDESSLLTWDDCNFVGVDLGGLSVGYARGLASRWGIDHRLQFVVDSAESCLQSLVESYPGPIKLCLIQFPTPYALKTTTANGVKTGNSQLPTSAIDGFMVTEQLLRSVHQALSKSKGKLLLQSNCEDVAVYMHDLAIEKVGFAVESTDQELLEAMGASYRSTSVAPRVPQRTEDWIKMNGKRAEGDGWSKGPILHRESATETEVACSLNGTPIHRCVLRVLADQQN